VAGDGCSDMVDFRKRLMIFNFNRHCVNVMRGWCVVYM